MARAPVCLACGTWLEAITPLHFHQSCQRCGGAGCEACSNTGLHPAAAAVRWQGFRLSEFLALTVDEARERVAAAPSPGMAPAVISGNLDQAIFHLQVAVKLKPELTAVQAALANLREAQGKRSETE